jgi:hypothetical protein
MALSEIKPAPWNARAGHAVEAIAESISVNGFRDPIEVWAETGEIVAGEGRYHAAVALGLSTVPVILHVFDSLASARRYSIANNRLAERSAWDLPALQADLKELQGLGGLTGTGFDAGMLANLVAANNARSTTVGRDNPDEFWEGMPDYGGEPELFRLVVTCESKEDQDNFLQQAGIADHVVKATRGSTLSVRWPLEPHGLRNPVRFEVE